MPLDDTKANAVALLLTELRPLQSKQYFCLWYMRREVASIVCTDRYRGRVAIHSFDIEAGVPTLRLNCFDHEKPLIFTRSTQVGGW